MKHTNANLYPNETSLNSSFVEFRLSNPTAKITKVSIGETGRSSELAMVFDWED